MIEIHETIDQVIRDDGAGHGVNLLGRSAVLDR
jgi:hypothetical protein